MPLILNEFQLTILPDKYLKSCPLPHQSSSCTPWSPYLPCSGWWRSQSFPPPPSTFSTPAGYLLHLDFWLQNGLNLFLLPTCTVCQCDEWRARCGRVHGHLIRLCGHSFPLPGEGKNPHLICCCWFFEYKTYSKLHRHRHHYNRHLLRKSILVIVAVGLLIVLVFSLRVLMHQGSWMLRR